MVPLRGVIALYGLLDIADGIEGYMANAKLPWLVWNVGFGGIVLLGVAIAGSRQKVGYLVCATVAGLDIVFFGLKLVKAPALWPAGVITCAAIAALACSVAGIVHARAPRR
ncbi:MAG: hypothetical protein H0W86_08400 [Armatimonadetes bacterium]|nr:hypothetical protein [Armatimonadota bacterium]